MLNPIARFIDHIAIRTALVAALLVTAVLLGPLALLLLSFGPLTLLTFALGLAGLAGLVGASARLWLGPRIFLVSRWARLALATCLAVGAILAFALAFTQRSNFFWVTPMSAVGLLGILLLVGSMTEPGSSKPPPFAEPA